MVRSPRFSFALISMLAGLTACSRTPPAEPDPTVAITQPTEGQAITFLDDEDPNTAGVQFTVKAHVTNVTNQAKAVLSIDGSAIAGTQQSLAAGASDISFAKVTLPAGSDTVRVQVDDANGKSALDFKSVTVQSSAACTFTKPASTLTSADDENPATPQMEAQVVVHCPGIASATPSTLKVSVLVGAHRQDLAALSGTADANGDITFDQAALGEGQNSLIFSAGGGAYSAQTTVTVNTGACPVVLGEPGEQIFNVAGGAPTSPDDTRPATADQDPNTAGIQESFTAYTDPAVCPAGSTALILFDGNAHGTTTTDSEGKATFTNVTIPDGDPVAEVVRVSASSKSGTSQPNLYGVDSVVPQFSINQPSSPTLTAADDLDPATAGLQTQIGIHATAGIDSATQVSVVDNGAASALIPATTGITLDASGNYVFPQQVTLPSGSNVLVATATRRLGNVATASFTTNVTQSSLSVTLLNPASDTVACTHAPGDTTDEDLGTPDCDITMLVQLDASATTVDFTGSTNVTGGQNGVVPDANHQASVQFHIPQGDSQTITATAHDATGATQSVTATVSVHTIGPEITITSPTVADSPLSGQQQSVTVHVTGAAANEQVTLTSDNGSGPQTLGTPQTVQSVDGSGAADLTFSNVQLPLGQQTITATISDSFGNQGTASVVVTVVTNGQCDITVTGGSPQVFNIAGTQAGSAGDRTATISGSTQTCKGLAVTLSKVVGNGAPQQVATATADAATGNFSATVSFTDGETDAQLIASIGAGAQQGQATVTYTADFTAPSFDALSPAAGAVKVVPNGDARSGSNGYVADEVTGTAGGQFTPNIVVSGAGRLGTVAETGSGSLTITGGGLPTGTGLATITDNAAQTFNGQLSFLDGAARTVTLTATDAAGNSTTATWSVAVASQATPTLTMVDPSGVLNVLADLKPFHTDHIDYHGFVTFSAQIASGTQVYICSTTASPGATTACQLASPAGTQVPGSAITFGGSGPAPASSAFWADLQFAEGSYQVFAEAVSAVGDVADSPAKNLTVDSVPPSVASVSITEDTDGNHVLNQAELAAASGALHVTATFTGVENGQTATLTGGPSNVTATVTAGAASFALPTSSLTDGNTYSFKVQVKDAAGNPNETTQTSPPITNSADAYTLKLASAAPSISVLAPTSTLCNASSPGANTSNKTCQVAFAVSVAGEDGNAITNVTFTGPGAPGSPNNVVTPDANGDASATYIVPEGQNQVLTATATDSAGNTATATVTMTVDVTGPALVLNAPSTEAQQDFSVTVTTNATDVTTVTVLSGTQTIGTGTFSGGTATVSVHAPIGNDVLTAQATDVSGNSGTSNSVNVQVSQPGCDIQFTNPAGATLSINASSPGSPPNTITVTGNSQQCKSMPISFFTAVNGGGQTAVPGTYSTDASGNFSVQVTLQDGATTVFTAKMTDNGGTTTTTASFTATVDVTQPSLSVTAPTAGSSGTLYVVAQSGNRHVAAGDQGYVADTSALTGGQVSVSLTINGGGSATGSGNGTLLITDKNGNTLATQAIASNGTVQFSPTGTPLVFTLPQAYQGAVNFKVTDAAGNIATASWPSVAVDVVRPPAPTLVTIDPGDGGYTHVANERHADLVVAFTKPTDDGLAGQDVTMELGYSTSTRLDGGRMDETAYANSNLTTVVPVTTAANVTAALDGVPPLNTYYLAPRAVDAVGNVSSFAEGMLDVNWTKETIAYPGTSSNPASFGQQIAVGDINGDGKADFAVFAEAENNYAGAIYVYYGGSFPLGSPQVFADRGPYFGYGASLGDIDHDGRDDMVLVNNDHVEAYLSSGGVLPGSPTFTITGDPTVYATSIVSDLNGDGIKDLVVSAPYSGSGGTVYIFWGRASWQGFGGTVASADVTLTESIAGAMFGGTLNPPVSFRDVGGGAGLYLPETGANRGLLFSGTSLAAGGSGSVASFSPVVLVPPAGTSPTQFGYTAAELDLNGDGAQDVVLSARDPSATLFDAISSGSGAYGPVAAFSDARDNYPGFSLATGDLTEDGHKDLVATAPGVSSGALSLFRSVMGGNVPDSREGTIRGGAGFGTAAVIADVNGDGHLDLIVGESVAGNGSVYVVH